VDGAYGRPLRASGRRTRSGRGGPARRADVARGGGRARRSVRDRNGAREMHSDVRPDVASGRSAVLTVGARLREAATHTVIYGLGSVLQTVLGFLLIPLYTRYYTPDVYGVFTLLTLAGTVAGAVFFLGGSSALARSYYDSDSA